MRGVNSLTPENWAKVLKVISGGDSAGVSLRHASRTLGIARHTVYSWVARSRKMLPEDEPWIHEIHKQYDEARGSQGEALEDKAWRLAMKGDEVPIIHKGEITGTYNKTNPQMIMRMLEARDPNYKRDRDTKVLAVLEADEIFNRLLAAERFRKAEEQKKVIVEQRELSDDADLLEAYEECSQSGK